MYFTRPDKSLYAATPWRFAGRLLIGLTALLATIPTANAQAKQSAEVLSITPSALAFARYVAFLNRRDVFTESGPVAVEISALLPRQGTQVRLTAFRDTDASERSEYDVVQLEGDPTAQVIVERYLSTRAQVENLRLSALLVTPANYKFRYIGLRYRSGALACVFQIIPRKRRIGLIRGQLWIDPVTGAALRLAGRFVKAPSASLQRIDITCDVDLHDGFPYERITHAEIDMPRPMYRAELKITEKPLKTEEEQSSGQLARGDR
jgi:hypothetical protein